MGVGTVKIDRNGQASVLSPEEIGLLFNEGLQSERDRALFGTCLYTGCRIAEACALLKVDVFDLKGRVRQEIVFRKGNTKGKLATRTVPVTEDLRQLLLQYQPHLHPKNPHLFPGRHPEHHWRHLHPESAGHILQKAFERVEIEGASTHSFRRTCLTQLSNSRVPLRVIQEISGHRSLGVLQKYLEVQPEQIRGAMASLSHLSYVRKQSFSEPPPEPPAVPSELPAGAGEELPY